MKELTFDVAVVGAGAAGLAAAVRCAEHGLRAAVIERETIAGGILNQCVHNGFGLHYFKEDLTGPEYAERFVASASRSPGVHLFTDTTAMRLEERDTGLLSIFGFSPVGGITRFAVGAVVLAMGCRERNRGNINIPGTRPAGIFTAGLAQRLVNVEGYVPGQRVVIVGSGDIGLIMARRMTWVGARVLGVVEIQPYPSGLTRNIVQCLNDFGIPLHLSHVVSGIRGRDRIEGVEVTALVDGTPDPSKTFEVDCDTLLLSVGLIPDNEVPKKFGIAINPETGGPTVDARLMTSREGVFACGNVLHVHDLVDWATEESLRCADHVVEYLRGARDERQIPVAAGANVRYLVPNRVFLRRANHLYFRSLVVKNKAKLQVAVGERVVYTRTLPHVQPSEMIGFELGAGALEEAAGEPMSVEVSVL